MNIGRRNLAPYVRVTLALELESTIAARAKVNQGARNDIPQNSAKSSPVDTREQIASIAGVSHDTVAKVKTIKAKASDATTANRSESLRTVAQLRALSIQVGLLKRAWRVCLAQVWLPSPPR